MNDITIGSGSPTPTIDPTPPLGSPAPAPASGAILDTSSTAASVSNPNSILYQLQQPNSLYLNVWSKFINEAAQNAREQISSDDVLNANALKGMRINAILTAQDLIALVDKLDDIGNDMNSLYNQQLHDIDQFNNAVNDYNTAIGQNSVNDQGQINTLNAATQAYLDSDQGAAATATYQAAIDVYNNYTSTRDTANADAGSVLDAAITTYQENIADENAKIDQINAKRLDAGLPLLPYVSDSVPAVPAIPNMPAPPTIASPDFLLDAIPPTDMSLITTLPDPPASGDDLLNQYVRPLLEALIPTMEALGTFVDQITSFRDFLSYYLGAKAGKVSFLPNAYIDRKAEIFLDTSVQTGSGAGVGLSTMIAGLGNPTLERLVSSSLAADAALKDNLFIPPQVLDNIRLANLAMLSKAALGSVNPAITALAGKLGSLDADSPAVKLALIQAFIKQIGGLSGGDEIRNSILEQLKKANPNADTAQLAQLADTLAADSKLSLLLFSLSQLSQALNLPDLSKLIIGLLDQPGVSSAFASAAIATTADVLANPFSVAYLKADLAQALAGYGIYSDNTAQDIVKGLILNQIKNESQLKESITKQLIDKGVSDTASRSLADRAAEFVQLEIKGEGVLETAIPSGFSKGEYLRQELIKQGIDANLIIASDILKASTASRRELRDTIAASLIANGLNSIEARRAATEVVISDLEDQPAQNLSKEDLAAKLTNRIIDQTSTDLGADQAQQLASQLAAALIGDETRRPFSIANQIQSQIEALYNVDDARIADKLRSFFKPTYDLFSFNKRIMDPANNIILSVLTGIMYSPQKNHLGYIDIVV